MVGYHPQVGHPTSQGQGWSPSIPGMVTYQPQVSHIPKYCCPASQGWSPMIPSMVTHHPKLLKSDKTQRLQLSKEFDTSAAQLVTLMFRLCVLNNLETLLCCMQFSLLRIFIKVQKYMKRTSAELGNWASSQCLSSQYSVLNGQQFQWTSLCKLFKQGIKIIIIRKFQLSYSWGETLVYISNITKSNRHENSVLRHH